MKKIEIKITYSGEVYVGEIEETERNQEQKDRQFIDDFLYRKVKLCLGMDYPENWEDIITFCHNDIKETADKDFTSEDIIISFRRFLESKRNND